MKNAGPDVLPALLSSHNMLLDGETSLARRWGMTLGAASKTYSRNVPEGARR